MKFLQLTSFLGWFTGILLLDRPWGIPRFTSWLSISTLISLTSLLTIIFLTTDIVINRNEAVEVEAEISKLGRHLSRISSMHRMIFYFITRFTFFFCAKKLAQFINQLYYFPSKNGPLLKRNLKKFDSFIIVLSYTCSAIVTINITIFTTQLLMKTENFLLHKVGPVVYGIIFAVIGIFPISICDTIAFSVVVATVRAILRIFKEFCDDLEYMLLYRSPYKPVEDVNDAVVILQNLENEFKRFVKTRSKMKNRPDTREEILRKFFDVVDVFEKALKVTAPFVFVILVVTTVDLVATVSNIVVIRHRGVLLLNDVIILIKVAIHLCLLQVGHRVKISLAKGKCQVRRAFAYSSGRHEMRDVVNAVISWEWQLSGLGFFDVDRKLAAGIISLLLSYVVIIFQLQLALSPNAISI